jgi:hypothetical protein
MRLWTTKLIWHFMYTRFGVEYCRERVRLHRLRPRHLRARAEE